MSIIHNFCITSKYYKFLDKLDLNVIISGSNSKNLDDFPSTWHKDNSGINISSKNKNFGTLTSHYWIWKNILQDLEDQDWIGINHYRRFWVKKNEAVEINISNLYENILREIPPGNDFEVLLPEKMFMENIKISKLLKKGFQNYIRDPSLLFIKKKVSIKLHFDLFHGYNLLTLAASCLNNPEKVEFEDYINKEHSFYPLQIFVSNKKIINDLYEKTFSWISKCEDKFSNLELAGYGKERLYDFLAERYFSFYFEKKSKIKVWPFIHLHKGFY